MGKQMVAVLLLSLIVTMITQETEANILSIETLESSYEKSGQDIRLTWRGIIDSANIYDSMNVWVEFNRTNSCNDECYSLSNMYSNLMEGQTDYTFRSSAIDDNYYNVSGTLEKYSYIAELFIRYSNEDDTGEYGIYNNSIIHIPVDFSNTDYYITTFEYTNYETITSTIDEHRTIYTTMTTLIENEKLDGGLMIGIG